ncbi:hypothetical protein [Aestuariivita sp.]|jgi:hypothetical protein|uniref:hypothetical protein n=1 Tax=Aestuariivita sp. TaxID=1872407 RepID=UPI00217346B8|nr:hypothetical protein [Aestuariivita sp.]MCE8005932.1 hypothetical protein [Aestuariivita sp.]
MSEPVKNAEIEDVLSSIRRLVSEDQRKPAAPRPAEPSSLSERLVLTPALRVPDAVDEPEVSEVVAPEPDESFGPCEEFDAQGEREDSATDPEAEMADPEHSHDDDSHDAPGVDANQAADASEDEEAASDGAAHDALAAMLQGDQNEDDGNGEDLTEAADQNEPTAEEPVWADPDTTLYEAAAQADQSADTGDNAPSDGPDARPLGDKIAALEKVIAGTDDQWEPDDPGADDYAGTDVETLEWEDTDPDADEMPTPTQAAPEAAVVDAPYEDEPVDMADTLDPDLSREDALLDEEALRELVADIVREELQGALGERITRNVRKLVRREIHRALAVQELE